MTILYVGNFVYIFNIMCAALVHVPNMSGSCIMYPYYFL
jgi:hypothetical protein